LLGYEGLEVINPDGGTEDAEEEALRGRWKQEVRIRESSLHSLAIRVAFYYISIGSLGQPKV
jgi:hypothetical protein